MVVVEEQDEFRFNDCNACERSKITELTHLQTCSFYKEGHCNAEDRGTENLERNPFIRYLEIMVELTITHDEKVHDILSKELEKCILQVAQTVKDSEALDRICEWMHNIESSSKLNSMVSYSQVFAEIYALLVDAKKIENCEVQNLDWNV